MAAPGKNHWSKVTRLMVDETSVRRGHRYVTVVLDAASRDLLLMVEGRSGEALAQFAQAMSAHHGRPEQITHRGDGYEPGLYRRRARRLCSSPHRLRSLPHYETGWGSPGWSPQKPARRAHRCSVVPDEHLHRGAHPKDAGVFAPTCCRVCARRAAIWRFVLAAFAGIFREIRRDAGGGQVCFDRAPAYRVAALRVSRPGLARAAGAAGVWIGSVAFT